MISSSEWVSIVGEQRAASGERVDERTGWGKGITQNEGTERIGVKTRMAQGQGHGDEDEDEETATA
jgi:hypothetical protein